MLRSNRFHSLIIYLFIQMDGWMDECTLLIPCWEIAEFVCYIFQIKTGNGSPCIVGTWDSLWKESKLGDPLQKKPRVLRSCLRAFHLLLPGEVLLTCTPLFRVKVRRPSLFSLSFQQLPLSLRASLPNPHDNSFYVHVYNCTSVNPGAHCVKRGQVRSVWARASVEGSLARDSIIAQKRGKCLFLFLPSDKIWETQPGVTPPACSKSHCHHCYYS